MSTDVASIMLPVTRGMMDREKDIDTATGPHVNTTGGPAAVVRGMKRGDPEQTAAALTELVGAECKRPRIDGTVGVGDIGQVRSRTSTNEAKLLYVSVQCVVFIECVQHCNPCIRRFHFNSTLRLLFQEHQWVMILLTGRPTHQKHASSHQLQ